MTILLTIDEYTSYKKVSLRTTYRKMKKGDLEFVQIGKERFIPVRKNLDDLMSYWSPWDEKLRF
ncbi:MAG: hypothetical protein RBT59_02290 [Arcobacteraceae bacterium]|jgi:excisionase family DNA binding protein|nr:hypothetical protein [Arcobacteraceae bacterium]